MIIRIDFCISCLCTLWYLYHLANGETNIVHTYKVNDDETEIKVGVTQFKSLIEENSIIVDKTLFIKEFMENPFDTILLTCPRHWGRSLNADMLKMFLNIEVDEFGKKIDVQQTLGHKLFAQGVTKTKLLISKERKFLDKHLGKHPVIHVSFKSAEGNTDGIKDVTKSFQGIMSQVYQQYFYIRQALKKDSWSHPDKTVRSKAEADLLLFNQILVESSSSLELRDSLKLLSRLLHNYFGKKVVIVLDDYDAFFENALLSSKFTLSDLTLTLGMIFDFLKVTFKENDLLAKGLILGVRKIIEGGLDDPLQPYISEVGNFSVLTGLEFSKYFGFTQDEVSSLFAELRLSNELRKKAKDWYGGYKVRADDHLELYNPLSVMSFLRDGVVKSYWVPTAEDRLIDHLIKNDQMREAMGQVIDSKLGLQIGTQDVYPEGRDYAEFELMEMNEGIYKKDFFKSNGKIFFCFLFTGGYLTMNHSVEINASMNELFKKQIKEAGYDLSQIQNFDVYSTYWTRFIIPNQEIATEFSRRFGRQLI